MTIKNIKVGFSTDEYNCDHTFDLEISEQVIEAIKTRRHLLARMKESLPESNDQLCFFPSEGIASELGIITAIHIAATTFEDDSEREGFMVELSDSDDYTYESEWLPYEALDMERFMLHYCDGDCDEYSEEDGDDIDDFTAIYANSLKEAKGVMKEIA